MLNWIFCKNFTLEMVQSQLIRFSSIKHNLNSWKLNRVSNLIVFQSKLLIEWHELIIKNNHQILNLFRFFDLLIVTFLSLSIRINSNRQKYYFLSQTDSQIKSLIYDKYLTKSKKNSKRNIIVIFSRWIC